MSTRLLLLLNKRLRLTFAAAVAAFQSEPEGSFAVDPAGRTLAAAAAAAAGEGSARGASSQPVGSESIAVAVAVAVAVAAAVAAAVAVVVVVVDVVDISFARPFDQAVSLLGVLVAS